MFPFPMTVYMLWRSVSISSKLSCPLASVVRGVVHHPFTIRDASSFVPSISNLCLPPHFPHSSERSLLILVISPMDKVLLHWHFLLVSLSSCSFMTGLLACSSSWELWSSKYKHIHLLEAVTSLGFSVHFLHDPPHLIHFVKTLPVHLHVRQSLLLLVFTLPTPPSVVFHLGVTVCVSRSRLRLCFPRPFLCLLLSSLVHLYFLVNSYNDNFHIYHYQLLSFMTISTGKFLSP